ncbi:response regulator [Paenibacillus sp. J22TS3]|uniref:response regulator transcription factor n=1 Tax=Paenibacillus sp. J22TS3 TaxID=2807192 RepID=UPI001B1CBCB8|nr:response regulator [Paenibacillus sp. J22TS3]GIP24272.1 AraC family transcriptional regulator [Paenibacillus sp. J22TS3]
MKVLIVDDEVIIRTGLSTVIRWEDHGYTILAPAASAEEALARIPEERPEIIFTDIRMTGKSGLDMASEVKKEFPETEVIVISGFDDFVYAQQALREGVTDYLLKTSPPDEILRAAAHAKNRIEQRQQKERMGKEQMKVLNRSFLRRLLASAASPDEAAALELWSRYPQLRLTTDQDVLRIWMISVAEVGGQMSTAVEDKLYNAVGEILAEQLPGEWLHWAGSLLFLVREEAGHTGWHRVQYALRRAEGMLGCRIFAACGSPAKDTDELKGALETAVQASSYAWLLSEEPIVRYEDIKDRKGLRIVCTIEEEAAFASLLKSGDRDGLRRGITDILTRVKGDSEATPSSVRAYLQSFLVAGYRWLERAAQSIGYPNPLPYREESDRGELASHPEQVLLRHCEVIMEQYSRMFSGTSSVQRAISYIHEHLDQSLSLAQVAKHVHMNPNYFSEMFKRETGQNYIEFVTQAKMRRAMTMLSETPAKISEVANQIGYEDIKYFNRLFKKFTGQTPSEFRSKS